MAGGKPGSAACSSPLAQLRGSLSPGEREKFAVAARFANRRRCRMGACVRPKGSCNGGAAGCGERNACAEAAAAGGHRLSAGGAGRADRDHRRLSDPEQHAGCAVLFLGGHAVADRHHRGAADRRARLRAGDRAHRPAGAGGGAGLGIVRAAAGVAARRDGSGDRRRGVRLCEPAAAARRDRRHRLGRPRDRGGRRACRRPRLLADRRTQGRLPAAGAGWRR